MLYNFYDNLTGDSFLVSQLFQLKLLVPEISKLYC